MRKDFIRRILLIIVSIFNWIFSVGYMKELYNILLEENLIEYVDNINIDGTDFTPLANLVVAGVNEFLIIITVGSCILTSTISILIFALLFRVIMIRKTDIIKISEVMFTKKLIIVSSALAFVFC